MSDSQPPSRSESVDRDGSGFFDAWEGHDEGSEVGEGQGGIFNLPSMGYFSPSRQRIAMSPCHHQGSMSPCRHVGYPFLFAPANPNIYGTNPESDKFRKLMLKKQERESKKPKNVRSEFKSERISGQEA